MSKLVAVGLGVAGAVVAAVALILSYLTTGVIADQVRLGTGTFLLGVFGAGVVLFASRMGLSGYSELPKRIFTLRNVVLYLYIGGGVAVVFWLPTTSLFLPIYAAGIGAAWPAAIQGLMAAALAKDISDTERQRIAGDNKLLGRG